MKLRTFFATLLGLIGLTVPIHGQYVPEAQAILPWGPVDGARHVAAVARIDSTIFVGGDFTLIGPPTGPAIVVDPVSGAVTRAAGVTGQVNAVVADGRGGWFIVGAFRLPTRRDATILRLEANGAVDLDWRAPAFERLSSPASLAAVELVQQRLFVGGFFASVDGEPRPSVAALDAQTGALLPWSPTLTGLGPPSVTALKHHNGALYIGGSFTALAGLPRRNLAAIDVNTGQPLPFAIDASDPVRTFSILGDTLYVGGDFTVLGGQSRQHAGAIALSSGALKLWAPAVMGLVSEILAVPGRLFVGGDFYTVNGQPRRSLAALDPGSAALLPFDAGLSSGTFGTVALGFDVSGSTLYVVGFFLEAQGQPRRSAAAFDLATGTLLSWSPMLNTYARSVAAGDGGVLVGGQFGSAGVVERTGFARIDLTSGRPLPATPNIKNVTAMLRLGDVIVMSGPDTLDAYKAATMEPLPWRPSHNGRISAMATDGVRLFVGGSFAEIAGVQRQHLAAFDLRTGALLEWAPQPGASVSTIATDGRVVYAGGNFETFPGFGRGRGAALDALTGDVLSWNPEADGAIETLVVLRDRVVVGGPFGRLRGVERRGIGSVDKSQGNVLEIGPISGIGTHASLAFKQTLIIGGSFDGVDGQPRAGLGALDAASGPLLPWAPDLSFPVSILHKFRVLALDASDDFLIAAGFVSAVDGRPASDLAVFPIARPGSPRALRASVAGAVATMSWEPGSIPRATSYQIEVGLTAEASEIGVFATTATHASGVLAPGTYFVRVRGVSSAGAGAPSSEIIFTIPDPAGPPQAPTGLTADVAGHAVTLSWQAAIGNPHTYILEAGSAPGLSNLAAYATGHLDTMLTTGAPPGIYFVRVRAANAAGVGPASKEVVVTVP